MDADFVRVGDAVVALIAVVFEVDSLFPRVLAEHISVAVLVAGGDQLLELQLLEVVREVVKKVTDLGIIAVAKDRLVLEMLGVMPQLFFDVRKLRVELILFRRLRGAKASVQRLAWHFAVVFNNRPRWRIRIFNGIAKDNRVARASRSFDGPSGSPDN